MLGLRHHFERGDTLIEVLFATAIFSLIAVGGLAIMNQGMTASQRALEITLVRNEIDAQAEALRFLNASYIAAYEPDAVYLDSTPAGQWSKISETALSDSASSFNRAGSKCPSSINGLRSSSFVINTKSAKYTELTVSNFQSAQTFSQLIYDGVGNITSADGIWVEAVSYKPNLGNSQDKMGYIDFHIRACWDSPG